MIEWSEGDVSFICSVWAWGSHIGEAVHKMLDCARQNRIVDPYLCQIDYYEYELPESAISNDDGLTFIDNTEESFPTEYVYRLPHGVILVPEEHELDEADIEPGYRIWPEDDEGLIEITAVVEEQDLLDVYFDLVAILDEIRFFWIKIADDWDDAEQGEMYTNESLNSLPLIKSYIEQNKTDTLFNGHLTLTAYSDKGATNINISDHKMPLILTFDRDIADAVCRVFGKRGLEKKEDLISIAGGFHHWHYRHPEGAGRKDLIAKLKKQGFSFWKPDPDRRYHDEI